MKILVNAISARLGGGQTYIRNLLDGEIDPAIETIYFLKSANFELPERDRVIPIEVDERVVNNPYLRYFWEKRHVVELIAKYGIDIYFCPGGSININPGTKIGKQVRTVMTFQNMLPFDGLQLRKYGISAMRLRNMLLKRVFVNSMVSADLVIFLSEFARDTAIRICRGKIKRAVLIPHGIQFVQQVGLKEQVTNSVKYLLYVSTLDVYKSQLEVIKAFALLKTKLKVPYQLFLVGSSYDPYENKVRRLIEELSLQEDVVLTGQVGKQQLATLYAGAEINIFASQTENCPFILLEAMAAGQPIACSKCPPMPEVAGDAVLYFDPNDPEDICSALCELLAKEDLRAKISRLAQERIKYFDLAKSSAETWTSIASLGNA